MKQPIENINNTYRVLVVFDALIVLRSSLVVRARKYILFLHGKPVEVVLAQRKGEEQCDDNDFATHLSAVFCWPLDHRTINRILHCDLTTASNDKLVWRRNKFVYCTAVRLRPFI